MTSPTRLSTFRERLRRGDRLLGTFVKTPHAAVIEVLGLTDLDCICIDAEHAPFDRGALDMSILAARAADLPSLVRVSRPDSAEILNALDLGATGVVVPHVATRAAAEAAVAACRYGPGGRGYAGSTRAARYTTRTLAENLSRGNAETALVAQIEDAEAMGCLDDIAAVEGIDALFVGRMDLTVSTGAASPQDADVVAAVEAICSAGRRAKRAFGMFTSTTEEARRWFASGASLFLLGSEQQFILQGARALRTEFDG